MPGSVVISSGHGKYVRGASGYLDEVDEARRVVDEVARLMDAAGVTVYKYHDDVSHTQNENLNRIVDYHNSKTRGLDISVHFNANTTTSKPMGCEVLYVSSTGLSVADPVVDAICAASGLVNRGPKKRTDLFFLNNTEEPAILIETCFVDSSSDAHTYDEKFEEICRAIAETISGESVEPEPPDDEVLFRANGRCSWFGGPTDTGVSASEGLAFIHEYDTAPHLFLEHQPDGTSGLARRLNPNIFYIACRWDYNITPKSMLVNASRQALVRTSKAQFLAWPADWGPNQNTGRIADLSPGLMEALGLDTDDSVEVIYPATTGE